MGAKTLEDENVLIHNRKPDFSGWATKADLLCSDGRTILKDAFKHQDKQRVPLVWQHGHTDPGNVLGHAILETREEGVYAYGYFNETDNAQTAKAAVQHKDINALSIFANKLKEVAKHVSHGIIREVSLVMAGANPGALIDNIELAHGDGSLAVIEDEAVIYTGLEFAHSDTGSPGQQEKVEPAKEKVEHADNEGDDQTIQDVYDKMSEDEKNVVHYMIGAALTSAGTEDAAHSDTDDKEVVHMKRNVFDKTQGSGTQVTETEKHELSHDDMKEIFGYAEASKSLETGVKEYAIKHGIENLEILFPEARTITQTPEWDSRRVEWVKGVLNGTKHSPFSRIKTISADITQPEARAKGYIKGTYKKEEWFKLQKRTTTPATVYKKQKLDRDDIIDIVDFDVVVWMKGEMRLMLDEELARAILIGDGRDVDDEDKIQDPMGDPAGEGIRSILHDHELYVASINIPFSETDKQIGLKIADAVLENMTHYKGTGSPTWYTTLPVVTKCLLARDAFDRRMWRTRAELASEIGVSNIVEVEPMEEEEDLLGIIVNLTDYTVGADKGGEINMFDDFDIDYNQYKYLLETRLSGALTKIRSALVLKKVAGDSTEVTPQAPAFNPATGVITPATTANITYKRADTNATVTTGAPITLDPGQSLKIYSVAAAGYYIEDNQADDWTFERASA